MERPANGLSGARDLYIPLEKKQVPEPQTSTLSASTMDDASSVQTSQSASSTIATSYTADGSKPSVARLIHRYTIKASTDGREGSVHPLGPKPKEKKPQRKASPSGSTVTISRRSSKSGSGSSAVCKAAEVNAQSPATTESGADEEFGTATIFVADAPAKEVSEPRTASPARPSVSRPRFPPTSYRGPAIAVKDDLPPTPPPPTPPPKEYNSSSRKKGPPAELHFGNLTLDEMSRAIDAPPSPIKQSGIGRLVRHLSGKRKNKEPTPPTSPRAPGKPIPTTAPQVARTESSSSIPSAVTSYSSLDAAPGPSNTKSRRRTLTSSTNTHLESGEQATASKPRRFASIKHSRGPSASSAAATSASSAIADQPTVAKPRRFGSIKHARFASPTTSTVQSTGEELPEPDMAYADAYYFTACPHTSPPSHRPLNTQPVSTLFSSTTLKYPAFHLRARLAAASTQEIDMPTINVLTGSCSDCDWRARRQQEGEVLAKYADIRNNLLGRIKALRARMAQRNAGSDESDGEGGKRESEKTEEDQDLELEMLGVESEIEELPESQDADVKGVWKGWAAKWGLGTVGIHRAPEVVDDGSFKFAEGSESGVSSGSGVARSASTRSASLNKWGGQYDDVVGEGRMKLDWIRPTTQDRNR